MLLSKFLLTCVVKDSLKMTILRKYHLRGIHNHFTLYFSVSVSCYFLYHYFLVWVYIQACIYIPVLVSRLEGICIFIFQKMFIIFVYFNGGNITHRGPSHLLQAAMPHQFAVFMAALTPSLHHLFVHHLGHPLWVRHINFLNDSIHLETEGLDLFVPLRKDIPCLKVEDAINL